METTIMGQSGVVSRARFPPSAAGPLEGRDYADVQRW